jgi:PEP-CTERM motif
MRKLIGRILCLSVAVFAWQLLASSVWAADTMADWVGRNNAPGATYTFDSQVLNSTNTASPTEDNYVVISPTSIGGQKQAKINYNQDPNRNENEIPTVDGGISNINYPHSYLADQVLDGGPLDFTKAMHMEGTLQFDMPSAGEVEPNFCFCWYNSTDTRHRVGLGLSNVVESPYTANPDSLRVDLFYASSAGNGFVYATKDGVQDQANDNSRVPDGTYSFVFDYVPGNDINSTDTTGSSMSATITDVTDSNKTWFATLAPLANAPWFFDGFALDKFGVIIRSTGGTVRNGVFDFNISNVSYTGGTAAPAVLGDYNGNGVVDAADYVLWRNGGPLQNEVDNPGTVDAQDYTEWRARFGNTSGSGSGLGAGAVPEPTTVFLALLAGLGTVASWRRRS